MSAFSVAREVSGRRLVSENVDQVGTEGGDSRPSIKFRRKLAGAKVKGAAPTRFAERVADTRMALLQ
jgi:hypothetical protein